MNYPESLSSVEIERHCISGLLKYPKVIFNIENFVDEKDFEFFLLRILFSVIKQTVFDKEEISDVVIAKKIQGMNISFEDDVDDIFDYIQSLSIVQVTEKGTLKNFQELKRLSSLRQLYDCGEQIKKEVKNNASQPYKTVLEKADKVYNAPIKRLKQKEETKQILLDAIDFVEERGENPVHEFGYLGPFETLNKTCGSILVPGNFVLVGARSGVGKSAISFYYMVKTAERYNYDLPILHIDCGEMTDFQMMIRSVCALSEGKVPIHPLVHGTWRQNKRLFNIIRDEIWPKAKKLKFHYINAGNMSPNELISFIRRFYFNTIGRGNPFLCNYDYFKALDLNHVNDSEWRVMGQFARDIKTFITTEIEFPFLTSIQFNKSGITDNKRNGEIDDSANIFGVSDRIFQQVDWAFILRRKTLGEISEEGGPNYGNMKLILSDKRRLMLGPEYKRLIEPVKVDDKKYVNNFINIQGEGFSFKDLGDYRSYVEENGNFEVNDVNIEDNQEKNKTKENLDF